MTDNEVSECKTVSIETTYEKSFGSAQIDGQYLEIHLLTLCKLRGDNELKDFYLAGNLKSAGAFDDVVFRYVDESGRQNVIFLQSKFKQNAYIKIQTFTSKGGWPLQKFFKSFTQIQEEFNNSKIDDPIFRGKSDKLNCYFVIYTNANRHDDLKEYVVEAENPLDFILEEKKGQAFKLNAEKAKKLLEGVQHDIEIEHVLKYLKQIAMEKCDGLQGDDNFKMYHAFFTRTVLVQQGDDKWKYNNDFLDGDFPNKAHTTFRAKFCNWYTEQFKPVKRSGRETNPSDCYTIAHMKERCLQLPTWFKLATPVLNKRLFDEFFNKAYKCISDNICTITEMSKELIKEVSQFVGNVLVFDEHKAMFKFNKEHFGRMPKEIVEYLTKQLKINESRQMLYFDIQVESFPRLSLGFTKIASKTIEEFADNLTILTEQPDVEGLKKIIQTSFGNQTEMEIVKYPQIIGKMTDWWKQLKKIPYLRKDDSFLDGILSGIVFNVKDPLRSFTGRKEEVQRLHAALQHKTDGNRTAVISQITSVSGLGGIGKTQLARQYIHEHGQSYDSIIWIDAETQDSMGNCFRTLCTDHLKISTQNANKTEMKMKSIVQQAYGFFQNRKSLFIFDNAQYFKNDGTSIDGVDNFLPATKRTMTMAHFLLTSRNQKWPNAIPIELNVLNDAEAEELVKRSLEIKDDQPDNAVKELAKQLQNFPLALQQAVAHIRQKQVNYQRARGDQFHISDYLELYKTKTKEFLEFKFPDDCDDRYTKTTFMTWNITLAEIEKSDLGKEAREIFYIMAYLSPNDIPLSFFSEIVNDREKLDQVFLLIQKYSMITVHNGMANIHRLVQSVTRLNLQDEGRKRNGVFKKTLYWLVQKVTRFDTQNYGNKQNRILKKALSIVKTHTDHQLIAVGASVWNYAHKDGDLVIEFKAIPAKIITALRETFRYEESSAFGKVSLEIFKSIIGNDHQATLDTQFQLARTLDQQGQYDEAISMYKEVLEERTKVLGPNHPATLFTKNNIALTLSCQGQYDEALSMYKEVLEERTKVLGPNHPATLFTKNNIALTLSHQGQYDEALSMYKDVLKERTKVLGHNHPDTLTARNNIALTLSRQGQYDKALSMYKDVLQERTKVLGPNHPDTLNTQNDIALTLSRQGQYDEALSMYKKVLEETTKVLGPNHPDTLNTQNDIALTLSRQGEYDEAISMYKEVLEKRTKVLGPNHPATLFTKNNIALTLSRQGQYDKALSMYKDVLQERTKVLGPNHPDTLNTQNDIALTLSRQGQYDEALSMYKKVLEETTKVLGPNHPDTLNTQNDIALTLFCQGQYDEALSMYKEVLEETTKVLGPNHPDTLNTQNDIALTLSRQGQYDEALSMYKDVLEERTKVLGFNHPDTLSTQHNIAHTLSKLAK